MSHFDQNILLDYLEQKLDQDDATRVEEHLQTPCLPCQQKLTTLRHVTHLMSSDQTNNPPPAALEKAMQIFRQEQADRPRQSMIAKLVFDSMRQPSLAAVRGVGAAHQYLFTAEEYDIDLHIKNDDNRLSLTGQILVNSGKNQPQPQVCLARQGETLDMATADSRGRFFFKQVSPGNYQLFFQFDDLEIAVQDVEV